ncbi:SH3 domain-containing protein [Aquimarina sp. I32.4]|uniref:SH3 domain-containing protein n=1 Tax=Aquimarina sp. I32.4 TaxID=2053903 RepID=UPI000CDE9F12|nr:SH3 domain-containing protein [Aquimarina sp. I32.4]
MRKYCFIILITLISCQKQVQQKKNDNRVVLDAKTEQSQKKETIEKETFEFPKYRISKGIINDKDGYVNIRKGKGTNFSVIGKIMDGEEFQFAFPMGEKSKWRLVKTSYGLVGYVHSSRIYSYRKNHCNNTIILVDQNWDVNYNFSHGTRKIDSIPSNLNEVDLRIDESKQVNINNLTSCIFKSAFGNEKLKQKKEYNQKVYKVEGLDITLIITNTEDYFAENFCTVVSIIEKGNMQHYIYYSELETITIYALKKIKNTYNLFGNLQGSPGNLYGGNFTVNLDQHKRIIKYEYYEFNG